LPRDPAALQVDGLRNPLVQSLYLQDCPIHTAAFAGGGSSIVAAGRRPFFYVADLHTGQLDRVVVPPCINLAPSGTPSNQAMQTQARQRTTRQAAGGRGKRGGAAAAKGTGSKGGIGMKSCEAFVASPEAAGAGSGLLAFLGDSGHIGLVSLATKAGVGALKMNGSARAAAFTADGRSLITAGAEGAGGGGAATALLCVPCQGT
jgi:U3 small nucleolar RNA-associated protein 18